ncbi:MAG: hypothetical protein E7600_03100 [Ruminococcaceae bacterium]|nr:hypothetical protein [Oscillospiraceae bacterium]
MKIYHKLKLKTVQVLWSVACLVLLFAGIFVIGKDDSLLYNISWELGVCMLVAGQINIFIYIKNKHYLHGARWLLADGMITVLLSVFPIIHNFVLPQVIPVFFGIWELTLGVLKFIEAIELYDEKIKRWYLFIILGCFEMASGVFSLIEPIDHAIGHNHVIALIFFVQAVGFIFKIIMYPRLVEKRSIHH